MKPSDPAPGPPELGPEGARVWQREETYWRLFCGGDPACLALVAEGFLGWPHTADAPQDKAALVTTLARYQEKPVTPTLEPVGVRVAGDVAVVHLLRSIAGPGCAPLAEQVPLRALHVWVRQAGEWYLIGGMGQQPGAKARPPG
ncbi:MAG: nuclear transport factor 2 family protein [Deferrisomatales bacterium]